MTSNFKFITSLCLSAGLGLCWYPLARIENLQIESSQLLFFAFSTASLLTVVFMARQVERWRHSPLELLIFALTGGISTVLIHYSLLHGNPIAVISLFCMTVGVASFLFRLAKGQNLAAREFITILAVVLVAFSNLMVISDVLVFHWSLIVAILAGVGFYGLWLLNRYTGGEIPIMSKLSALFIASTWLVGMILIFSTRSTSLPQEDAAFYSILYGAVILVPIMASVVFILVKDNFLTIYLWITMLLSANLTSIYIHLGRESIGLLVWPSFLLLSAYIIQLMIYKTLSGSEVRKNDR